MTVEGRRKSVDLGEINHRLAEGVNVATYGRYPLLLSATGIKNERQD
jgi:hypothetical protein